MSAELWPDLWVVMPAYNEASVLGGVLTELRARWPNVVVVDDASSDDTAAVARAAGAAVARHPINLGQGAALQTGITLALRRGASHIATFDADGQHRPADIDRMLAALRDTGADVALGSRFLGEAVAMPAARRLLLQAALAFTRVTTGLDLTDTHNGLRAFTARAAAQLRIRQDRMAHASEILAQIARLELKFVEVPTTVVYTAYSTAKGQRMLGSVDIMRDLVSQRLAR